MIKIEDGYVESHGDKIEVITELIMIIRHIHKHYDLEEKDLSNFLKYGFMSSEEIREHASKKIDSFLSELLEDAEIIPIDIDDFLDKEDCEHCKHADKCELKDILMKIREHNETPSDIKRLFELMMNHKDRSSNDSENNSEDSEDSDDSFFNVFKDLL